MDWKYREVYMEKVLTVSIAAYNIENYIENALQSLIVEDIMDKLEVIIVNDGSKDRTGEIAQKYVDMYPNTFILINKDNGGYGSTINYSTRIARGKYFKQLDGDDWFDTKNIKNFIETLEKTDSDLIITPFTSYFESDGSSELKEYAELPVSEEVKFDDYWDKVYIEMHASTFKTKLFTDNNIRLTEHCFYTDNEYMLYTIRYVETIQRIPLNIYFYRVGRAEQSCTMTGYINHFRDFETVSKNLLQLINSWGEDNQIKKKYIHKRMDDLIMEMYRLYTYMVPTKENKANFVAFDKYIKENYKEFESKISDKTLKFILNSNYVLYGVACRINRVRYKDRL